MATVPVGSWPYGIGVNPNTNMVYVANSQSGTVSVIDGGTNGVVATVASGSYPIGVAVNPNTNMVYVNNNMGGTVSVINGTSNTVVATISNVGSSNDISVNPNTNMVYVSENGVNSLAAINGSTNKIVTTIPVGSNPDGVAINPVTNIIYVANQASNTTSVIDGATNTVTATINVGNWPSHIAVNPNTNSIYVTNFYGGTVSVIDGATNAVTKTINVGNSPIGIGINLNTKMIYVANNKDGTVSIIDGSTNNVAQVLTVGGSPAGVGVNSNTNEVYVSNGYTSNGSVYVIKGGSSNVSAPSAPLNLQAMAGNSQVSLSWSVPSSNGGSPITNYNIYRGTSSGSETLLATAGNVTSYTDNTVTNGQTYFYKVTAVNSVGESLPSNEATATPAAPATVSSAPTSLTATTVSASQINLSWTLPASNGGSQVTGYMIQRSTDGGATWSTIISNSGSTSTAYSDIGLAASTTYTYRVSAINSIGTSNPSNTANATTGQYTGNPVIATIPVEGNPSGIAVNPNTNMIYVVTRDLVVYVINGTTNTVQDTMSVGGHTSSRIVAVNPNTNRIVVVNSLDPTNTASTDLFVIDGATNQVLTSTRVPARVASMVVNPETSTIYVPWQNWFYKCPSMSGVEVINGTKSIGFGCGHPLGGVAVNPVTNKVYVSDLNVNGSGAAGVWIIDGNTDEQTGAISGVFGYQMEVNPTTNRLYAETTSSIEIVDLSTNTVMNSVPAGYNLLSMGVNSATNKVYAGGCNTPQESCSTLYVIDGSSNALIQKLTVGVYPSSVATNPNTNRIYVTNSDSNTVSVIDGSLSTAPSAPQNLQAAGDNARVTLSWPAQSINGGSPINNYNIYRSTTSGSETFIASAGNVTSYTDNTVTNGQTYFYKVTAVNSVGESLQSNEAYATPAAPATVSSAPTSLTATTVSASQINLSWTAPTSNGGSQVTGYTIQRSTDGGATWSTIISNSGNTSTTYSDMGLASSTTYTYQISAINSVGTSPPSNTASATTSGVTIASGIVLNNVQSISGTTSSSNQITLSSFNAGTGSNHLLLVGISANNNSPVSVAFNGVQLTQAVMSFYNNDAEFWYLKSPAGTGDVTVTMGGPTQAVVGAYSFSGVNQTAPIATHVAKHNTTPNSPNISITTKYPNDLVLDLPSIYGGSTLSSPTCTQQWDVNVPNAITGASSSTTVQSPAAVACKWTTSSADFWDDVVVELRAN